MTEFRVTLTDGEVVVYKFPTVDKPCVTVTDFGQLKVDDGNGVVAAYGRAVWQRFERVAPAAELAWWPQGEGETR
jgi:hypothetical protein